MVTHGSIYRLARKLDCMKDPEFSALPKASHLELVRKEVGKRLEKSYRDRARRYNVRARKIKFIPGQKVFRRNHQLSDFSKNINAKMNKKYLKCRIVKPVGNCLHEIEDLKGKSLGVYHAKDLKQ
ncbi:uncharacterized protein LOC142239794 [Haematobia irritans]|uniref:uncharacterized protein LOC142239794 n=1 Tax=Haematobia irritans TaxID=7368 RepID=UPI003F508809